MDKISVVILSGGKSSRMGKEKAGLKIGDMSFAEHIAGEMSLADEILFSVRQKDHFPEIELLHIEDQYPGCGPLAGIHAALKACRNPWLFVVACDMPFVSWKNVDELYKKRKVGSYAIVPREGDGRLHGLCAFYHKNMLDRLDRLLSRGTYRVRAAFDEKYTVYVPVNELSGYESNFKNINTMKDYLEAHL